MVSGKHSISSHFPNYRDSDICLTITTTRTSCRRRTGIVLSKAENFEDLILADHKVLSEGFESRNNHRDVVTIQDFDNTVDTVIPMQNKNFSGNAEELTQVLGADEETQSHLH